MFGARCRAGLRCPTMIKEELLSAMENRDARQVGLLLATTSAPGGCVHSSMCLLGCIPCRRRSDQPAQHYHHQQHASRQSGWQDWGWRNGWNDWEPTSPPRTARELAALTVSNTSAARQPPRQRCAARLSCDRCRPRLGRFPVLKCVCLSPALKPDRITCVFAIDP